MPVTPEEIQAAKRLCEKATPGPWKPHSRDVGVPDDCPSIDGGAGLRWEIDGPPEPQLRGQFASGWDAHFIAAARDLLPRVLADLEQAQAENARLREFVRRVLQADRDDTDLGVFSAHVRDALAELAIAEKEARKETDG